MSYTSGWINFETTDAAQFTLVRAYSNAAAVQIYVNDELLDYQVPDGTSIVFGIPPLKYGQYIRLLAVDLASAEAETNYFSQAWPNDLGNRITVKTPTQVGWLPGELWRVYQDDVQVHERLIWQNPETGIDPIGGNGTSRGHFRGMGSYGVGRGYWRGLQRGYEPATLRYETDVLNCGTYEMAATTLDNAGNETTQAEENVTHNTYPREPEDLTVTAFNSGTGEVSFSWTESADL